MYDSESSSGLPETSSAKEVCKVPTRDFRVRFDIKEQYESGFQVCCTVDGVICLTKSDAYECITKRLNELWVKWEEHKTKM